MTKPADVSARAWAFGGSFTCSRYTREVLARAFDASTADLVVVARDALDSVRYEHAATIELRLPEGIRHSSSLLAIGEETLAEYTPKEAGDV